MRSIEFNIKDVDGVEIHVYKWKTEGTPKAVVQIAHGMGEHSGRYEYFAQKLIENGYAVYINDHRGHGKTAKNKDDLGYIGDTDGFNWMIKDMYEVTLIAKKDYKDVPIFLLGHSMGSFLTQKYIALYGKELKGALLSGTNGKQGQKLKMGIALAKLEVSMKGPRNKGKSLNNLIFKGYNSKFQPERTLFDWLTSDKGEVDKYITDEYCGHAFTSSFFYYFFKGLDELSKPHILNNIPRELPIYIFSGSEDPVGEEGKGVTNLYNTYKKIGIQDVTCKIYQGGRHEMLNEVNKNEVISDIITWMEHRIHD